MNGTPLNCAYCGSVHLIHSLHTMRTLDALRGFMEKEFLFEEQDKEILDAARGTRAPYIVETICCADCGKMNIDYKLNQ